MTSWSQILDDYIEAVVPHSGPLNERFGSWTALGRSVRRKDVDRHLCRQKTYGVQWSLSKPYSFAVIDLDLEETHPQHHGLVAECSLWKRYLLVWHALRGLPHVVLQSSSSRGLHVYVFFDREHPGSTLRRELVRALEAHGLEIRGGSCEVYPSNQFLRLPLGPGSAILDVFCSGSAVAFDPVVFKKASPKNPKRPVNDWAAALEEFLARSKRRISLDDIRASSAAPSRAVSGQTVLGATKPQGAKKPLTTQISSPGRTSAKKSAGKKNQKYWDEITAIKKGVTGYGRRNDEYLKLTWHLAHVEGKNEQEIYDEIESWLRNGNHISKDLNGAERDKTISRMLKATKERAKKLCTTRSTANHSRPRRAGPKKNTSTFASIYSTPQWREKCRKSLRLSDEKAVAAWFHKHQEWRYLEPRVLLFLGLMRRRKVRHGEVVSISVKVFERIAGHRSKTHSLAGLRVGRRSTHSRSMATELKRCLDLMGVARQVSPPQRGRACTHFLIEYR